MNYVQDCLKRKLIFFTGKGGVGKTTLAWATAVAAARRGKKVAVVGWRPIDKEESLPHIPDWNVGAVGMDTLAAFREYAVQIIRFQKLYDSVLDNKILRTFVLAAPGLADAVVAGKIWDMVKRAEYELLIVDMPSSGHALSFFKSPLGLQKIFKVGFVARDTESICALFGSPETRLDLISLPEELPLVECRELKEKLNPLHPFSFGYLHLNQCLPDWVNLPDSVTHSLAPKERAVFDAFRADFAEEKENLKLVSPIGMTSLRTPRFAKISWQETVETTAAHLETQ